MSMSRSSVFVVLLLGFVCLAVVPSVEAQCAMCRTALETSEQGRAMAAHFNRGILFLLGAPFGVAALIGIAMVRSRRRLESFFE